MKDIAIKTKTLTFLQMLNEDHIYLCPQLDYKTVCLLLDVSPKALDEALEEEVGHGGTELMRLMKDGYLAYVGKKYGFNLGNAQ